MLALKSNSMIASTVTLDGPLAESRFSGAHHRPSQLREAVLLTFCDPMPRACDRLRTLSTREWRGLMQWLDTSGLAIYFLDRLAELNEAGILPPIIKHSLTQRLTDNTERVSAMIAESASIQARFEAQGVTYAVQKGFSLFPLSVSNLSARSQLDLDFLVSEESIGQARLILEQFGYRLHAQSSRSLDFKANEENSPTLSTMYKAGKTRCAELHIQPMLAQSSTLLQRVVRVDFLGMSMPVLSPVDLLLGQGLHLFKHVCSQYVRAAHLIEFRRHVLSRYGDHEFWNQLRLRATIGHGASVRLGIVIGIISRVMGQFAPATLTCWTADVLPEPVNLWIDVYGPRMVLAKFPGTKLYLLLEQEVTCIGLSPRVSLRRSLFPRRLPELIAHAMPGESWMDQFNRRRKQVQYNCFRFRFSVVEGIRYLHELRRWRQIKRRSLQ